MKVKALNIGCSCDLLNPIVEYLSAFQEDLSCNLTALPLKDAVKIVVQVADNGVEIGSFTTMIPSVLMVSEDVFVDAFRDSWATWATWFADNYPKFVKGE